MKLSDVWEGAGALAATGEATTMQGLPMSNTQELVQSRIKLGLSQNMADVTANTTELANTLGVPPNIPQTGAPPTPPGAQQAAGQDPQQAMQMLSQDADAFSDGVTGGSAAAADQSATNVSPYSARRHTTAPW